MSLTKNPLLAPAWMLNFWRRLGDRVEAPETCRVCGKQTMRVHETMTTMPEFAEGGITRFGEGVVPFAMLTCSNCGHTQFHNLLELGVIDERGNVQD